MQRPSNDPMDTIQDAIGGLFGTRELSVLPDLPLPGIRAWRGVLEPISIGPSVPMLVRKDPVAVDRQRFLIGRSPAAHLSLSAVDISREHACIHCSENLFYLEDLGSRFGTYVNGTRVLACRLSDGDVLKLGEGTSFRFERRTVDNATVFDATGDVLPSLPNRPAGQMTVTFWGCRGSMPTSGPQTAVFGGNTTCLEVRFQNSIYLIDAGTGIAKFSKHVAQEFQQQPLRIELYFTHLHWDHIQGFPFFSQAYLPQTELQIYEVHALDGTIRDTLKKQMQGQFFPIPMETMKASMQFPSLSQKTNSQGLRIRNFLLPHPGGAYAYRFETNSESFLFASDCELDLLAANREEVIRNPGLPRQYPASLLEFFRKTDLLVIDCQYSDETYADRVGWGHNSTSAVADFCRQVRPRQVVLTHHDPDASDHSVRALVRTVESSLRRDLGKEAPRVSAAREEMCVFVTDPKTPAP